MVQMTINGRAMAVPENSTVLEACKRAHVFVPTLCYHPMLSVVGQCRLCLVEADSDGRTKTVAACATRVAPGMSVRTSTAELRASVQSNLRFLRCRHPNSCMTCEANGHCEFQNLAYRYEAEDALPASFHTRRAGVTDRSSHALDRDMDKCVLCSRCVRVCAEIQGMNILGMFGRGAEEHVGTAEDVPLAQTQCISCGQCTAVCPVGALVEKPHVHAVQRLLANDKGRKVLVAQTAPAVRVAISEEFGMAPGSVTTGKLVAALRSLGFDYVFDTNFAADLTIMEEATEFVHRLLSGGRMPMFTSCCPGWINLVEKTYPELLPQLSSCKSPQGMLSTLIRAHFARLKNVAPEDVSIVSIMPCVAKKDEIARPQLSYVGADGVRRQDTDYVLTTRELAHLIQNERIPYSSLPESQYDTPLGVSTGAAALFGATGGVMEAALRTAHYMVTGADMKPVVFSEVRDLADTVHGIKEGTVNLAGHVLNVAVVTGTANVRRVVELVLAGENRWHLIEVMACTGGCIGGGGEPKTQAVDPHILLKRIQAIHSVDAGSALRMSHHNPAVKELYDNELGAPNSERAHELLHTHYTDRSGEVRVRTDLGHGGRSPVSMPIRDFHEA